LTIPDTSPAKTIRGYSTNYRKFLRDTFTTLPIAVFAHGSKAGPAWEEAAKPPALPLPGWLLYA